MVVLGLALPCTVYQNYISMYSLSRCYYVTLDSEWGNFWNRAAGSVTDAIAKKLREDLPSTMKNSVMVWGTAWTVCATSDVCFLVLARHGAVWCGTVGRNLRDAPCGRGVSLD